MSGWLLFWLIDFRFITELIAFRLITNHWLWIWFGWLLKWEKGGGQSPRCPLINRGGLNGHFDSSRVLLRWHRDSQANCREHLSQSRHDNKIRCIYLRGGRNWVSKWQCDQIAMARRRSWEPKRIMRVEERGGKRFFWILILKLSCQERAMCGSLKLRKQGQTLWKFLRKHFPQ